jgi:hypothetical protein
MSSPMSEHDPDSEQATPRGLDRRRFAWLPGSVHTGPVPSALVTGGPHGGGSAPSRSAVTELLRGLDWQALLEALPTAGTGTGTDEDQEAVLAEERAAAARGALRPQPVGSLAALAAEHIPPGPAQAGWLSAAAGTCEGLDEDGLAGVAIAARRLAAWAQAAELAAVAQITVRAAAADPKIGLAGDGRPGRLCQDAISQVSLTLMLSDYSASTWADLAVTLRWRLHATGQALAAGRIDLYRARLIAEATSVLSEEAARAVEAKILPGAGGQVPGELRARLRRAVITADPDGAEQRRQQAERHARLSLYGDHDGTATLTGSKLPAIEAAAAMARITALARAMKAAGQVGGLDLHRARVMLGLLLGTLPYIPPAEGAPTDDPPPGDDHDPGSGDPGGGDPGGGDPGGGDPGGGGPGSNGPGGGGPGGGPGNNDPGAPWNDLPDPSDEDAPDDDGWPGDESPSDDSQSDDSADNGSAGGRSSPDDYREDLAGAETAPQWPALGAIPPGLVGRTGVQPAGGRPVPGLLDVTLPWTVLARLSYEPGTLGRIGPVTAVQARRLAQAAVADPAAQWRIIVTDSAGHAIAVSRIRRRRLHGGPPPREGPPPGAGLVGRVTLTISQDVITEIQHAPGGPCGPGPPGGITATAFQTAARALAQALAKAQADNAAGGCAHQDESYAYRPPPRLRDYVTARDVTCRFPPCRQPAWRADLDHTLPWDDGGRTCRCNVGGRCRRHHQLKQHPRWKLRQGQPGDFTWTTPAGRTYTTGPDIYPA